MAFNAGAAVGVYRLDNSQFIRAVSEAKAANTEMAQSMDKSDKKTQSMTGSFIKAGVALEAIKKGANIMLDLGKSFVVSASNLENLNAEFTVMLGSADKAKSLVGEIRKMGAATPFGTEDLANASKTLLQFGIAQKDIIGTLGMLGDVAGNSKERLNSLALVFGQISSAGKLQGQDLMQLINVGFNPLQVMADGSTEKYKMLRKEMEKGNITIEDVTNAFKKATSEGGLFYKNMETQSQTLTGLWSTMQDEGTGIATTIGTAMLPILKDMVKETINLASSTNAYLQSAEGMQRISAIFSTISGVLAVGKGIFQEIADTLKGTLSKEVDQIKKSFDNLLKSGSNTFTIFDVLSVAVKFLSMNITIATKVAGFFIQGLIDLGNIAINVGKSISAIWDLMTGKAKTKEDMDAIKAQFSATGLSIKNFAVNYKDNINDIINTVKDGYKDLFSSGTNLGESMKKNWLEAKTASEKYYAEQQKTASDTAEVLETKAKETAKVMTAEQIKAMEEISKSYMTDRQKALYEIDKKAEEYRQAKVDEIKITEWAEKEKAKINDKYNKEQENKDKEAAKKKADANKALADKVIGYVTFALESAQKLVNLIADTMNASYQNELDALQIKYDEQTAIIEQNQQTQTDNNQIQYDFELAQLQEKLQKGEITQKQFDEKSEALAKKKEETQKAIDQKAAADKAAIDKKKLDEENEIKKKQFESNKAWTIANIWIQFAIGTVAAFAQGIAQLGPVAGSIIGAVTTALLLATAIAETVVVSQQQFVPARASGGDAQAGQPYQVGEMGREIFVPGVSGTILNSQMSREILNSQSSNVNKYYNIDIHDNTISDKMDLEEITDHVIDEIGKRVG